MLMMQEKHGVIRSIDIDREDACRVEHDLSDETFAAICAHAQRGAQEK
ncbi:MAG: hypothetical protein ACI3VK_00745 [Oscillospiraceae bacterium]